MVIRGEYVDMGGMQWHEHLAWRSEHLGLTGVVACWPYSDLLYMGR
jgi:hypothetical protein